MNLGSTVNGPELDDTPVVSPDRRRFYRSRGWGGIYEISTAALPRRR